MIGLSQVENLTSEFRYKVQKGFFFNPEEKLFLKFQFNPAEISSAKSVSYNETEIPLYPTKLITWGGNSARELSFKLQFITAGLEDARQKLGVLGIEAVLESFMLPAKSRKANMGSLKEVKNFLTSNNISDTYLSGGIDGSATQAITGTVSKLYESVTSPFSGSFFSSSSSFDSTVVNKSYSSETFAPPDCYFVFGSRWFKTKLKSADFNESNYNRSLVPRILDVDITLYVIEDGEFAQYLDSVREVNAKKESGYSLNDMKSTILQSSLGAMYSQVSRANFAVDNLGRSGSPRQLLSTSRSVIEMPLNLSL